ncbi:hypothetical protein [Stutzerimonas nitrititolerans]|uniref:hypothetical protein n=1 Tax=Stutzerimonas nitrititolerans TaxID=2482751 RepID=UPI0028A1A22A|nr:hypothetical protein [Stutzerimonas nitrititolerans]
MSIKIATQLTANTSFVSNRDFDSFKSFFEAILDKKRISSEKDGPTFTPSFFRAAERNAQNVIATSLIVLDVDQEIGDDLVTMEEVEDALIDMAIEHAVYTSYSNNTDVQRFRIVMPLSRPVYPAEFLPVAAATLERLDDFLQGRLVKVIDGCWRETSRCYYTFTVHPERQNGSISFYNAGKPLDVLELKMSQSSYGLDHHYSKNGKPREPGMGVGAPGRSMELNRILGGMFRSNTPEQITRRIFEVDRENNPGSEYFYDQSYTRHRPKPGESADRAAYRACELWVKSHLNWLIRKVRGIDTTIVNRKAQSKEPMPTHEAMVRIKNMKDQKTQKGADTILAEVEIISGEHAGRHLWHRFYGQGSHPTALKISSGLLEKLEKSAQLPKGRFRDAVDKEVILHARIKYKSGTNGFPAQNEIGTFFPAN